MTQEPLFELPEQRRPPPRMATKPGAARYTRYRPRVRQLCGDCIRLIHVLGVAAAPLPRGVRWRRTAADGVEYLCEIHKDERMECE